MYFNRIFCLKLADLEEKSEQLALDFGISLAFLKITWS